MPICLREISFRVRVLMVATMTALAISSCKSEQENCLGPAAPPADLYFQLSITSAWGGVSNRLVRIGSDTIGHPMLMIGEHFSVPYDSRHFKDSIYLDRGLELDSALLMRIYARINSLNLFCLPDSCVDAGVVDGGTCHLVFRAGGREKNGHWTNCWPDSIAELLGDLYNIVDRRPLQEPK
jgi:hypothetical protein